MNARATLVMVWLAAGAGAVGGSILGNAGGQAGLFVGAIIGGLIGALFGVRLCARFGWIAVAERRAATIGAMVGFLVAAPIAVTNLHTPVIPVLVCSLAGAGALIGAGRARGKPA
jgi:uncharacterized membrane protein YraQ (UPF0718 family)